MAQTKKRKTRNNNSNNNNLTSFEKIQFLQFEYDWQKKRLDDLYDKSNMLLCWDAAVFTFAIMFTDIENIISIISNHSNSYIYVLTLFFTCLLIISVALIAISSFDFLIVHQ